MTSDPGDYLRRIQEAAPPPEPPPAPPPEAPPEDKPADVLPPPYLPPEPTPTPPPKEVLPPPYLPPPPPPPTPETVMPPPKPPPISAIERLRRVAEEAIERAKPPPAAPILTPPPKPIDISSPKGVKARAEAIKADPGATQADKAYAAIAEKFNYQLSGITQAHIEQSFTLEERERLGITWRQFLLPTPVGWKSAPLDDYYQIMDLPESERLPMLIKLGYYPEGSRYIEDLEAFNKKFGTNLISPYASPELDEYITAVVKHEGDVRAYEKAVEAFDKAIKAFETDIKEDPKWLQDAYHEAGGGVEGIEAYNTAVESYNKSLQESHKELKTATGEVVYFPLASSVDEEGNIVTGWDDLPDRYKTAAMQSYDAMIALREAEIKEWERVSGKLKDYHRVLDFPPEYEGLRISSSLGRRVIIKDGYETWRLAKAINDGAVTKADVERVYGAETAATLFIVNDYITSFDESDRPLYNLESMIKSDVGTEHIEALFPIDVINATREAVKQQEKAAELGIARAELANQYWYIDPKVGWRVIDGDERAELIKRSPILEDQILRYQPALVLPADKVWQGLKDRPKDDPERQAYYEAWVKKGLEAAAFASLATLPYGLGVISAAGRIATLAPAATVLRAVVFPINAVTRIATHLTRILYVAVPPTYLIGSANEAQRMTQFNASYAELIGKPKPELNKLAEDAGYRKDFDRLTDAEKANVLIHATPPQGISVEEWSGTLAQVTEKLIDLSSLSSEKIEKAADKAAENLNMIVGITDNPVISAPFNIFGGLVQGFIGLGSGTIEGGLYMMQIPLISATLLNKMPMGTAPAFAGQVGSGIWQFMRAAPGVFAGSPYGAGRMVGVFAMTPKAFLRLSKGLGYTVPRLLVTNIKGMRQVGFEFAIPKLPAGGLTKTMVLNAVEKLVKEAITAAKKGKNYAEVKYGNITARLRLTPWQKTKSNTLMTWTVDQPKHYPMRDISVGYREKGLGYLPYHFAATQAGPRFGVLSARGDPAVKPALVMTFVGDAYKPKARKVLRPKEAEIETMEGIVPWAQRGKDTRGILRYEGKESGYTPEIGFHDILYYSWIDKGSAGAYRALTKSERATLGRHTISEYLGTAITGWYGRIQQLKAKFKNTPKVEDINKTLKRLREQTPDTADAAGNIATLRAPVPQVTKAGLQRVRITVIPEINGQLVLSRAYASRLPKNVWESPGGGVHVITKGKRGGMGIEKGQPRDISDTYGRSYDSNALQTVKEELGLEGTKADLEYLGLYRGKATEYALPGTRVYILHVRGKPTPDLWRYTLGGVKRLPKEGGMWMGRRVLRPENEAYTIYDPLKQIDVTTSLKDIVAAIAKKHPEYGITMSRVIEINPKKISFETAKGRVTMKYADAVKDMGIEARFKEPDYSWMKYRDAGFIKRAGTGKVLKESQIKNINKLEIKRLKAERATLLKGAEPSLLDYFTATPDVRGFMHFMLGRRRTLKILRDKKITPKEASALVKEHPELLSPESQATLSRAVKANKSLSTIEQATLIKEIDTYFNKLHDILKEVEGRANRLLERRGRHGIGERAAYLYNTMPRVLGAYREGRYRDDAYMPLELAMRIPGEQEYTRAELRTISRYYDRLKTPEPIRILPREIPEREKPPMQTRLVPTRVPEERPPIIPPKPPLEPREPIEPPPRVPPPREPPVKPPIKPPMKPPEKPPPRPPVTVVEKKVIRVEKPAPITWYQGKLYQKGKLRSQWYVINPPFKTIKDFHRQWTKPKGATLVEGVGAAYKSIQQLGYPPPQFIFDIDWGAFDLTVKTPTKKMGDKKALGFKRDVKGRTKKPHSVSDIKTVVAA